MPFYKPSGLRLRRRLVLFRRWILPAPSPGYSLLEPTVNNRGTTPGVERLLKWTRSLNSRLKPPERPPKGHLVVYVGGEEKGSAGSPPQRYVVPVVYFNHPLFGELLREVEDEFGFRHPGVITIPCSVCRFERIKERIDGDSSG